MKASTPILAAKFMRTLPAALLLAMGAAHSATTDISNTPLSSSSSASVLPNLMFVLDDSGSMAWDYLPDFVDDSRTCKPREGGNTNCNPGDPPYYSAQFNRIYYNPQITYRPAVNFDGSSMGNMGSPWTSVPRDAFGVQSGSSTNLVTSFPGRRYCVDGGSDCKINGIDTPNPFDYRSGSPDDGTLGYPDAFSSTTLLGNNVAVSKPNNNTTATVTINNHGLTSSSLVQITDCSGSGNARRNIEPDDNPTTVTIINANTFSYVTDRNQSRTGGTCDFEVVTLAHDEANNYGTNPHYFTITPKEHCSDSELTTCVASTTPTATHTIPAYVRYCKSSALANAVAPVTGQSSGTNNCQATYTPTYEFPRYGLFTRTDIVPATATYGNRPNRTDCAAAPVCTYAEEMTNFANWFAYYQTRLQTMKSAGGRAFLPIDDRYRVGFLTINPVTGWSGDVSSTKYLKIDEFDAAHKEAWYKKFYQQGTNGSTPLREALSRVGRHFAGKTDGINKGMSEDPMQYSCQQNFSILTSDGYWNGSAGLDLNGNAVGNQDNVNSGYSTRSSGSFDGGCAAGDYNNGGCSNTLADVAMYYYKTDLRPTGSIGALGSDVSENNVPTSAKDTAPHQHMTTFTLGMVNGLMTFRPDYESAPGDFNNIRTGASGCSWAGGTCNWPVPKHDTESALDDLWHAAVNGRGTFYQAQDPNAVADGLSSALAGLNTRTAAAAASATSSPNITPTDRSIFSSTYTTVEWSGQVVAQDIDPATGNVVPAIKWSAQDLLDAKVTPSSDTRVIHMFDSLAANKLKPFLFTSMTAAEQAYFANKCVPVSNLSQCATLAAAELLIANGGKNMVNFLRGQTQHETIAYRDRQHTLGDTVNATPAYMREPRFAFADAVTPDYASFKTANASRQATLFIAANDGMLHAFNADTGQEMWAYVPSMVLPNLYKLAEDNYASKHQYFVDGSPELMDAYIGGAWKTILVGGLNSGGRGYYALDVTAPASPKALWEFCSDSTLCAISDTDLGLTYGNPVITKRPSDGKWVVLVTSGYNNVSPGTGRGYLFVLDAATGAILDKIDTGEGDTTSPAGLGKISAWADNGSTDNTGKYVYAGDLLGNIFRFDFTTGTPSVVKLGELTDSSSRPQSVTTRPELALVQGHRVAYFGTGRYLGVSDLQDPATWVPASTDAYQQSLYAIKDKGIDYGNIRADADLVQQTITVLSDTARTSSTNAVDWGANNGWYIDFNPSNDSPGERVNIDPTLVLGTLVVVTNVPNNDACTIGGESWFYQFNYQSGQYLLTSPDNAVATKLGNAVTVGIVVVRLPSGQLKAIATDAAGGKTPSGVNIGGSAASGKRTSWREIVR